MRMRRTQLNNQQHTLSITEVQEGQDGSHFSHSHERQYYFSLQSLKLWREIVNDMFRLLWAMTE